MENSRPSNSRPRATIRKAQIAGALAGAILTIAMLSYAWFEREHSPSLVHGDDAAIGSSLATVILVAIPTALIGKAFGFSALPAKEFGTLYWIGFVCVVTLVNSFLFFLIGSLMGWLIAKQTKFEPSQRIEIP